MSYEYINYGINSISSSSDENGNITIKVKCHKYYTFTQQNVDLFNKYIVIEENRYIDKNSEKKGNYYIFKDGKYYSFGGKWVNSIDEVEPISLSSVVKVVKKITSYNILEVKMYSTFSHQKFFKKADDDAIEYILLPNGKKMYSNFTCDVSKLKNNKVNWDDVYNSNEDTNMFITFVSSRI